MAIVPALIALVAVSVILTAFRWSRTRGRLAKAGPNDLPQGAGRWWILVVILALVLIGLIRRWMGQ